MTTTKHATPEAETRPTMTRAEMVLVETYVLEDEGEGAGGTVGEVLRRAGADESALAVAEAKGWVEVVGPSLGCTLRDRYLTVRDGAAWRLAEWLEQAKERDTSHLPD